MSAAPILCLRAASGQKAEGHELLQQHDRLLNATALLALFWVIVRAAVQSITIDEADTYLFFVARPSPTHWETAANNHVLNSLLMRLFTSMFGTYHLTVRLPALLGAAIYISAALWLVKLIAREVLLEWPLLVCLVMNPFVMDHLVAARGYSLALGFFMAALAMAVHNQARDAFTWNSLVWSWAPPSICSALSCCANFSFGVVNAAAVLAMLLWACRRAMAGETRRRRKFAACAKLLGACTLPGLLVALLLTGSVMADWSQKDMTAGATSLLQTARSLLQASLYRPNPFLLSPPVYRFAEAAAGFLFPVLAAACLWHLIALWRCRARPRAALVGWLFGILATTLAVHRLLYHWFHILLPFDRTAVFLAPLCTLLLGAIAAVSLPSRTGRLSRRVLIVSLYALASYFVVCLRLNYFKEWQYNAAAKDVYSVLSYYNHTYGVTEVSVNWRYVAALNFYRSVSGHETLQQIGPGPAVVDTYPAGKSVYVVYYPADQGFLAREKLKIVFHDDFTEAAVAIRPDVESRARPVAF